MTDDDALLIAYVMDELPLALRVEVEQRATSDADFAQKLAEFEDTFGACALLVPPCAPRPEARERLLAATTGPGRFLPFVERLARLLDVATDAAQGFLARIDDALAWSNMPVPGIQLMHLTGGPTTVGADVGFVLVPAGQEFPYHVHRGHEQVLVLQGGFIDDDGSRYQAGDQISAAGDTAHRFTAMPGVDLIYAVVVHQGVTFPELGWEP